jgi:putative transposase
MVKEQEAGMATADVCRKHGLSPTTLYKLKAKYGGMNRAGCAEGRFSLATQPCLGSP